MVKEKLTALILRLRGLREGGEQPGKEEQAGKEEDAADPLILHSKFAFEQPVLF